MKKVFFALAAVLACSVSQVHASEYGERGEYYEHGERNEHDGRYGYGSGYYEGKFYGLVESMPQGGILGMWRIGGRDVLVTERTFIKEEYGRIGLGAQVEVKGGGNPFMAYKVEVKSGGRAMMGPPPANFVPPAPPPPAMVPPPAISGPVEAMPQGSLFGMWKIGGKDVIVTDSTLIKQQNGPLAPGAQVEVRGGGIPFIAHELEVKVKSGIR
ncbi:MAG: DUF5666 domain-containing protein [Candidatus Electronema sp. V4]|uniref:DUF5666 domain-containing protein n=1 Tax=Candidatus Electronema sp. V4 TaxID=3454756 RepID=UPI00405549E5